MITVKFFSLIRLLIKQNELILPKELDITVRNLLIKAQQSISTAFLHKLIDDNGDMITGTIILINGRNVHHLQNLDTIVEDGDIVSLFPPGGGG